MPYHRKRADGDRMYMDMTDVFLDYIFSNKRGKIRKNPDIVLSILKICLKDSKRDINKIEKSDSRFNKAKTYFQNNYKDVILQAKTKDANTFNEQDLVRFIKEVKTIFFTMERISKINEYMNSEHEQVTDKIIKRIGDGKTASSPIKEVTTQDLIKSIDNYNKMHARNNVLFLPKVTNFKADISNRSE